jgi:flagellar biosynthesis component FlhA
VRIGLRQILLIAAVVLFVVAAISGTNPFDLLAFGLACLAGAFVVEELGFGKPRFGRRR